LPASKYRQRNMTSSPMILDEETAVSLRVAIARLYRRLRSTAASTAAGLTPSGSSVLLTVARRGQIKLSELAETEGLNPTMLSRVISDLAQSGLVARANDPGDRRVAWVKSTPAGRRLAERMRRERTAALNGALEGLPAEDRKLIERALPALERLAEQLQDRRA
jgi:DNA-binding MarR family transcriptional regulator